MLNAESERNTSSAGGLNATIATPAAPKEKRRWFSSLNRHKKSQSQTSLVTSCSTYNNEQNQKSSTLSSNNNELPLLLAPTDHGEDSSNTSRKRKDDKNLFQRFRKKIGIRLSALRRGQFDNVDELAINGTTDASSEFVTHSPARKPQLAFTFAEPEFVPFTHDYKRFISKKWLEGQDEPNRIMYKACCEMLNQVWYWGEISRRDAQKQLTDKPTGSFLVRNSETSGCQFTLSFRIVNVTLHYRLEYRDNYWHFEELQYESIVEMIEDILYRCTNDNFVCFVKVPNEIQPPFPVILKYPISRYLTMPLLQDLCRRVIQRHATPEIIAQLPIPPKLLEYLSEQRELVFQYFNS